MVTARGQGEWGLGGGGQRGGNGDICSGVNNSSTGKKTYWTLETLSRGHLVDYYSVERTLGDKYYRVGAFDVLFI